MAGSQPLLSALQKLSEAGSRPAASITSRHEAIAGRSPLSFSSRPKPSKTKVSQNSATAEASRARGRGLSLLGPVEAGGLRLPS